MSRSKLDKDQFIVIYLYLKGEHMRIVPRTDPLTTEEIQEIQKQAHKERERMNKLREKIRNVKPSNTFRCKSV